MSACPDADSKRWRTDPRAVARRWLSWYSNGEQDFAYGTFGNTFPRLTLGSARGIRFADDGVHLFGPAGISLVITRAELGNFVGNFLSRCQADDFAAPVDEIVDAIEVLLVELGRRGRGWTTILTALGEAFAEEDAGGLRG